jgi:hypothetical protein
MVTGSSEVRLERRAEGRETSFWVRERVKPLGPPRMDVSAVWRICSLRSLGLSYRYIIYYRDSVKS